MTSVQSQPQTSGFQLGPRPTHPSSAGKSWLLRKSQPHSRYGANTKVKARGGQQKLVESEPKQAQVESLAVASPVPASPVPASLEQRPAFDSDRGWSKGLNPSYNRVPPPPRFLHPLAARSAPQKRTSKRTVRPRPSTTDVTDSEADDENLITSLSVHSDYRPTQYKYPISFILSHVYTPRIIKFTSEDNLSHPPAYLPSESACSSKSWHHLESPYEPFEVLYGFGYSTMQRWGFVEGCGLGLNGDGIKSPLLCALKKGFEGVCCSEDFEVGETWEDLGG